MLAGELSRLVVEIDCNDKTVTKVGNDVYQTPAQAQAVVNGPAK
jgi:hypothetical protein